MSAHGPAPSPPGLPDFTGLPEPPAERDLPHAQRRRGELVAMITADRRPGRSPGLRPGLSRWAIPLAAAGAVAAIAVTAAALIPLAGRQAGPEDHPSASESPRSAVRCPPGTQCQRTESFAVRGDLRVLTVNDPVGQVVITGSDQGSVQVTEHLSYPGLPPVTTRSSQGGTLALGYTCRSADCGGVSYDIAVPRSLRVQITSGVGSVALSGLSGPVRVTTGVGSISARGLSGGTAALSAGTGSIDAAFQAAPERLTARCGVGAITLRVPGDARYAITAQADLGQVQIGVPQDASSGHVINAQADTGSIKITSG